MREPTREEWARWTDAIEAPRREAERKAAREAAMIAFWQMARPMSPEAMLQLQMNAQNANWQQQHLSATGSLLDALFGYGFATHGCCGY